MIHALRRQFAIYGAIAAVVPQEYLAYNLWFWAEFIAQILTMILYVYFWRAVYAGTDTLGGMTLPQTLNYILLARVLAPVIDSRLIFHFGFLIQQGQVAVELTRPLNLQARYYVEQLTGLGMYLLHKLPLLIIAIAFFGLRLPTDPGAWLAVVRVGVGQFFGGALVPLAMMPGWLQNVAAAMPFGQALAVPLSFLSGVTSPAAAPGLWLVQLAWVMGLGLLSRLVFNAAVRKVTVQGG